MNVSQRHRAAVYIVPQKLVQEALVSKNFAALAAFNRINALGACKSAEHGWLGASYSCMELLSMLHLVLKVPNVVLAKGHAAAAQYAVLYGLGQFSENDLRNYKNGEHGLEAHADLQMDTGSLGMCLSSVAGMVAASEEPYPAGHFAVILGDGEMQEGQIYEALMTIQKFKMTSIVPFIDLNGFQSDNCCDKIMPIFNLEMVLKGFGYEVIHIDGHNEEEILAAWDTVVNSGKMTVILANTNKAGGTELLNASIHPETGLMYHPWHTKVPDWKLYIQIVEEQLRKSGSRDADESFFKHLARTGPVDAILALPNTHRPTFPPGQLGTGKAFGKYLVQCLKEGKEPHHTSLAIVDADLATSCGVNGAVGHAMYFELGISEQDAVSFAAGLALRGKRPVVNTYSNFLKRGFENMFISILENANTIFAGHYSGLCYHTDGKSHQSFDDLSVFSSLHPRLLVVDPVTPKQTVALLEKALLLNDRSIYFRLRRTPSVKLETIIDSTNREFEFGKPLHFPPDNIVRGRRICFITIGTIATELAFTCRESVREFFGSTIVVVPALNCEDIDRDFWRNMFKQHDCLMVVEHDVGALYKYICSLLLNVRDFGAIPSCISKSIDHHGPSQRTLESCLKYFGFTPEGIKCLYTEHCQKHNEAKATQFAAVDEGEDTTGTQKKRKKF